MIIRWFCRVVMHLFFSTVRVHHRDRLPATGAVLIVSNHHSSLVDPVALLATMPRMPRFLAKSALWDAKYLPLRPFLWLARAIPVYRHVDGGGDNTSMFEASHDVLGEGDVIALFGEGVSHNMPGLLDLKTGAARIALGADTNVAVVPVGIIYDDRAAFRSRAMIYVADPITVEGSAGGEADRQRVRELTEQISEELDEVAPSWGSWEEHNAAMMAARLTVADSPGITMGEALTMINRAVDDGTDEGHAVLAGMRDLEAESARLGLDIETVVDRPRSRVGRLNTWSFVETALFFLPTVLGRMANWPPHALIGRLAQTQDLNFQATAKILCGIFIYPLWWIAVAVAGSVLLHPAIGFGLLIGLPLAGYLSSRTYGRLRRFRNRQVVRTQVAGAEGESSLIALRHAVLNATEAVIAAEAEATIQPE